MAGLLIVERRRFRVSRLSTEDFEQLHRTRRLVMTEMLWHAIRDGDEAWRADVQALSSGLALLPADEGVVALEAAIRRFDDTISAACPSPRLRDLALKLYDQSQRYQRLAVRDPVDVETERELRLCLAEAVGSRQPLKACRILERHLEKTASAVRASLALRLATGLASQSPATLQPRP